MPFCRGIPVLKMTISSRAVAIAWVAVSIVAVAGVFVQRAVLYDQGLKLKREGMRGVLSAAESTRATASRLGAGNAFNRAMLLQKAREASDYRSTLFYDTVPIVSAWKTIQEVADKEGYEFRIPSRSPRNAKNAPTPQEEKILSLFESGATKEFFEVDTEARQIVYARPIFLDETCLACHGTAGANNAGGKDVLGFRMEGWRAGEMHGAFVLRSKLDSVEEAQAAGLRSTFVWLVPILLLVGLVSMRAMRPIRVGLGGAVTALERIADGDLTHVEELRGDAEVTAIGKAIHAMRGSLQGMIGGVSASIRMLSEESSALAANASSLASASETSSTRSESVAAAAEQVSTTVSSVSASMQQANGNLGSVASHTEQMTLTIGEVAGNSERARVVTEAAVREANLISEQMNRLGESAQQIGRVTDAIRFISSQTNLLALNATIEAARAGSAGKGFAVVAREISQLSEQTSAATGDIQERIQGIQAATSDGIAGVTRVREVIMEVSSIVTSIAAAIEEQSTVSANIAQNISEAASGVADASRRVHETSVASVQIAQDIMQVNASANQLAESGQRIRETVQQLSGMAEELRSSVAKFRV